MGSTVRNAAAEVRPNNIRKNMSSALINRSLTTIRTELEFLFDSEVIDQELYDKLRNSIPGKYQNGMPKWDLQTAGIAKGGQIEDITNDLQNSKINDFEDDIKPPANPPSSQMVVAHNQIDEKNHPPKPPTNGATPLSYCKAIYDYNPQEPDDLHLKRFDKLCVIEHLSEDWWKGYKKSSLNEVGIFPSNYVEIIDIQEFNNDRSIPAIPEKAEYAPPPQYNGNNQYDNGNGQYGNYGPGPQYNGPPGNYNGYNQYNGQVGYPQYDPSQNQQFQQQPVQVQQEQQSQDHPHLKKFGSKLGNSIIFGAGATIGSDLVNSIF